MLTQQEIFNTVKTHLLTQMVKARNGMGLCVYRTEDGLKCAVGCLMSDEFYAKYGQDLEQSSVSAFTLEHFDALKIKERDQELLRRLQTVHDAYSPAEWPNQLRLVADKYRLAY